MARHHDDVASLVPVVRAALRGGRRTSGDRTLSQGLAQVEAWGQGEPVTREALAEAEAKARAIADEHAQERGSPAHCASWAAASVAYLCKLACQSRSRNGATAVFDAACLALTPLGGNQAPTQARLQRLRDGARAAPPARRRA